jgi:hypothetical protein
MPKFRITACHVGAQSGLVEFTVMPIRGELKVGDKFLCFDTHHTTEYQVREVRAVAEHTQLVCSGWLGFDEQFTGATIDTSGKSRSEAFKYERRDHVA